MANGYGQKQGIDYSETFSPTARMESIRTLMQLANQNKWKLHQMDVKGAYLHAPIEFDVFVQQPLGYEQHGGNFVWKLNKSLYGLKQSGRNWNKLFHQYLTEMSFRQSNADPCVFSKTMRSDIIILLEWVDDIIIISSSNELLKSLKSKLSSRFNMKNLGELSSFLGIDFIITDDCITMPQSRYLSNILQKFVFDQCKPRSIPCESNPNAYLTNPEPESNESDTTIYRKMVGSHIYAMSCTRPDLTYCVTRLAQHLSKPDSSEWIMLKHVFRYIKHTIEYKLTFHKSTNELRISAYNDADWASSKEDRRSITGYYISLNEEGPPISWKSKKQASVALSTCEAEYMALSITCQESIFIRQLLTDIMPKNYEPTIIRSDNQGAIALIKNPMNRSRSKHIDIRYHFIRDCYKDNC